jgi:hypothetical protein
MRDVLYLTLISAVLLLCFALCGCSRVQYVPVETVRIDSTFLHKHTRDSIYVLDSVFVSERGDTIVKEKVKYIYKDKTRTDTLYIEKRDTVRVPVPVERKLSRWEEVHIALGKVCVWVMVAVFIYVGFRLYKVFR